MNLWIVGLTSGVVATAVSAVFQLINGWRERVAADKRHLREIALKAAIAQWEHDVAEANKANQQLTFGQQPRRLGETHFDMILVKKLKLIDIFSSTKVSEEGISEGIKEMGKIQGAITREFTEMVVKRAQAVAAARAQQQNDPNQRPLNLRTDTGSPPGLAN